MQVGTSTYDYFVDARINEIQAESNKKSTQCKKGTQAKMYGREVGRCVADKTMPHVTVNKYLRTYPYACNPSNYNKIMTIHRRNKDNEFGLFPVRTARCNQRGQWVLNDRDNRGYMFFTDNQYFPDPQFDLFESNLKDPQNYYLNILHDNSGKVAGLTALLYGGHTMLKNNQQNANMRNQMEKTQADLANSQSRNQELQRQADQNIQNMRNLEAQQRSTQSNLKKSNQRNKALENQLENQWHSVELAKNAGAGALYGTRKGVGGALYAFGGLGNAALQLVSSPFRGIRNVGGLIHGNNSTGQNRRGGAGGS